MFFNHARFSEQARYHEECCAWLVGCCFGGTFLSPVLCYRQFFKLTFSSWHRLGLLCHAVVVKRASPSGPSLGGWWSLHSLWDGMLRLWSFLLAAIHFPILGANFLRHHLIVGGCAKPKVTFRAFTGWGHHCWCPSSPICCGSLFPHQSRVVTAGDTLSSFSGPLYSFTGPLSTCSGFL